LLMNQFGQLAVGRRVKRLKPIKYASLLLIL